MEEALRRLEYELGVSSIDDALHKELSELSVYVNVDLYTWFFSFLDQEQIKAPASRIFLSHLQQSDHTPILVVVQLLHLLDQEVQEV